MEKKSICNVVISLALLFTGACSLTDTTDLSPEEAAVESAITSWPSKWKERGFDVYGFTETVLEDIQKISEVSRQKKCCDKLAEQVLSVSFEDGPKFPLEHWNTRPISVGAGGDEDMPRLALDSRHCIIVSIGKLFYRAQNRLAVPMEERMKLVFRFADKMEQERKRLKAMEVGSARDLIDDLERDLWYHLQGYPTKEKQRIRAQFEKVVGRSIRDPDKIFEDRKEFLKRRTEASHKMLEEFKKSEYERLMRRRKQQGR